MQKTNQLMIITGMSGAGKRTVSNFFEDSGFFCMDNLPPELLPKFMKMCAKPEGSLTRVAVVIDTRGGSFFDKLFEAIKTIKATGTLVKLLFLEASEDILVRRFSETRRKHPFHRGGRILDEIRQEHALLEKTRKQADIVIDTTDLTARELHEKIRQLTQTEISLVNLSLVFISFGFKYGVPIDCDLIFDLRFLPNPYYVSQLKGLTGLHKNVVDYVFNSHASQEFSKRLKDFITFLLPHYIAEPRPRLQIGIGCTGGRHRSVAYTEFLYKEIEYEKISVFKHHRDILL